MRGQRRGLLRALATIHVVAQIGIGCGEPLDVNLDPMDVEDDDLDGDGYPIGLDCDDGDPEVHPNAPEVPYDGLDQDCDGGDLEDVDGDGFRAEVVGGDDCDDQDLSIHPGAEETCDQVDRDCDGEAVADLDGDGHDLCDDCDDGDPYVHPGAVELCDGEDNDCDGEIPSDEIDDDGDGYLACGEDCDDTDDQVHPDALEQPYDGLDNDCVDGDLRDVDGDGYDWEGVAPEGDCDDENADVHPGALEYNDDGVDSDCDGLDDRPVGSNCYWDTHIATVPGSLELGLDWFDSTYGPMGFGFYFDDIEFEATAGTTVTVAVFEQAWFDPYLYLLDNTCTIVAEDDNGGADGDDPMIQYVVPTTAVYTAVVTTVVAWETGAYGLQIW